MSHTQGINTFDMKETFMVTFYQNHHIFFIILRTDVPRDEFGFYGWTEDFGPDSIVNLALRS